MFGEAHLRNVRISDRQGEFLTSPDVLLDWAPGAYFNNRLHISRLEADRVRLLRLPKLKPTARKGSILPGFDVHVGNLEIRRLELARAVTGTERIGALKGSADIRSGKALIRLQAD